MNIVKAILPYGLVSRNFSIKKIAKNLLPTLIVNIIQKKNANKTFTTKYLKNNDVSDLTESEKWALLSILLFLERTSDSVNYLEIGIYAGSTIKFLKNNSCSSLFTGIDLFEDFKPSDDNTHLWRNYTIGQVWEAIGHDRVKLIKGDSVVILNTIKSENTSFDFIFIDGNHTYSATRNDFHASLSLLKPGGYIAFHNCSPGMTQEDKYYIKLDGGPWMVTHELILEDEFRLVTEADRIRIFKKII